MGLNQDYGATGQQNNQQPRYAFMNISIILDLLYLKILYRTLLILKVEHSQALKEDLLDMNKIEVELFWVEMLPEILAMM